MKTEESNYMLKLTTLPNLNGSRLTEHEPGQQYGYHDRTNTRDCRHNWTRVVDIVVVATLMLWPSIEVVLEGISLEFEHLDLAAKLDF